MRIKNEITPKDLNDFKTALKYLDNSKKMLYMNSVILDSNGGSGETAEEIGRLIRARKLNTYLAPDAVCASACVAILIGGVQRYVFGDVRVHRATFMYDSKKDNHVEKFIVNAQKSTESYVKSMGVSMMLADAIESTESWSIRQLTELEKKQWQIFGFDRVAEEFYFNQIARDRHISRTEFIDIFKSNYDDCLNEARAFKQTIFDCAKSKKLKDSGYYIQFLNWISKNLEFYLAPEINRLSFHEQVDSLRKQILDGNLYRRYATITEIKYLKPISNELQSLDALDIQKMEAANKWWVEGNVISIFVINPIEENLKEVIFEMHATDCNSESSKKRLLSLQLLANLGAKNKAVYSGQLPFNYYKEIGKGIRCGFIKAAYK